VNGEARIALSAWDGGWAYTIRFRSGHCHRSPLRFTEASDALVAGEHDAATYLAADERIRR
jgi:formylmethanofuran dehydrogenase subunit B